VFLLILCSGSTRDILRIPEDGGRVFIALGRCLVELGLAVRAGWWE